MFERRCSGQDELAAQKYLPAVASAEEWTPKFLSHEWLQCAVIFFLGVPPLLWLARVAALLRGRAGMLC